MFQNGRTEGPSPLVEGSVVSTRYGPVKTDHMLFIAAGAFHGSSPADLIPELQGRFPLRVSLDPLSEEDLLKILTEPENCILDQYLGLLAADGLFLSVDDRAKRRIAETARYLNDEKEDIAPGGFARYCPSSLKSIFSALRTL